jgi:phage baseplate assembly protein W
MPSSGRFGTFLLTNVGEVPFLPNFGSRLDTLLFEPIDPMTTAAD